MPKNLLLMKFLYVTQQLISKSTININRDDVNAKFKCDIKTG